MQEDEQPYGSPRGPYLSTAGRESVASCREARCGGTASALLLEEARTPRRSCGDKHKQTRSLTMPKPRHPHSALISVTPDQRTGVMQPTSRSSVFAALDRLERFNKDMSHVTQLRGAVRPSVSRFI